MAWLKYVCFVLFYALYVIGYTFQTACTRSGQTCLTNDPKQRPLFTVFNTVASLIGIWQKDRPEFFGVGGTKEKVKLKDIGVLVLLLLWRPEDSA